MKISIFGSTSLGPEGIVSGDLWLGYQVNACVRAIAGLLMPGSSRLIPAGRPTVGDESARIGEKRRLPFPTSEVCDNPSRSRPHPWRRSTYPERNKTEPSVCCDGIHARFFSTGVGSVPSFSSQRRRNNTPLSPLFRSCAIQPPDCEESEDAMAGTPATAVSNRLSRSANACQRCRRRKQKVSLPQRE